MKFVVQAGKLVDFRKRLSACESMIWIVCSFTIGLFLGTFWHDLDRIALDAPLVSIAAQGFVQHIQV